MSKANTYKNGNYFVTIFTDGTKIRIQPNDDEDFIPAFSESTDTCITRKCGVGCPFCYEGCSVNGKHGDLFKYPFINNLHPYTEMALNGNDLDHPDIEKFLEHLHIQKVYTNITVHQNQFINNYERLKEWQRKGWVHGIGVSLNNANEDLIKKMNSLDNTVLHTIIGILSEEDINILKNNNIKVLMLGYKDMSRGITYKESHNDVIDSNRKYVYDNIKDIVNYFDVLSFDNLALKQLDVKRILSEDEWNKFYMGDDGHYTFYIDLVEGLFAKNSISTDRYPIGDMTIDEMFQFIQNNN